MMQDFDYQLQREEEAKLQRLSSELPDYNWLENKIRKSTEFTSKINVSSPSQKKEAEIRKVVPPLRIKNTSIKSKSVQEMAVSELSDSSQAKTGSPQEEDNGSSHKKSSSEPKQAKPRRKKNLISPGLKDFNDDIAQHDSSNTNGNPREGYSKPGNKDTNGSSATTGEKKNDSEPFPMVSPSSSPCDSPDSNLVINCDESSEDNCNMPPGNISDKENNSAENSEGRTSKTSPELRLESDNATEEKCPSAHPHGGYGNNKYMSSPFSGESGGDKTNGFAENSNAPSQPSQDKPSPTSADMKGQNHLGVGARCVDPFSESFNASSAPQNPLCNSSSFQMYESYIMRQKADLELLNKEILRRKQELDKIRLDIFNERQILGKVTTRARHMFMEMEEKYQSTLKLLSKVEELHKEQKQSKEAQSMKDKQSQPPPQTMVGMPNNSMCDNAGQRHYRGHPIPIKPKPAVENSPYQMTEQDKINTELVHLQKKIAMENALRMTIRSSENPIMKEVSPMYSISKQTGKPMANIQHWMNQQVLRGDKNMPPLQDVAHPKSSKDMLDQAKEVEEYRKVQGEKDLRYLDNYSHDLKFDKGPHMIPPSSSDPKMNKSTLMDILSSSSSDLSQVYPYSHPKLTFDYKKSAFRPPMTPQVTFVAPNAYTQGIPTTSYPRDLNSYGILGNSLKQKERPRPYGLNEHLTHRVDDMNTMKNKMMYQEGMFSEYKPPETQRISPKSAVKPDMMQNYQALNDPGMARRNTMNERNRMKMYYEQDHQAKLEHDSALMRDRAKLRETPSPSTAGGKKPRVEKKDTGVDHPLSDTRMNSPTVSGTTTEPHVAKQITAKARHESRESVPSSAPQTQTNSSQNQEFDSPKCSYCHNTACFICSGCRKAWYCSETCQRLKWSQHAPFCQSNA